MVDSRTLSAVLAVFAVPILAGDNPSGNALMPGMTPTQVVESALGALHGARSAEAAESAFLFVSPGAAEALQTAETFERTLETAFNDVLDHTEHDVAETSRADDTVCVRSNLTGPDAARSAISWCLQRSAADNELCGHCWMIHHFERIAMLGAPLNGDAPADSDDEGFQREPEGRLHVGLESESDGDGSDSTSAGMSDEFKMGLGIVLGFLTLIAVVVGALLTKLIRQNKLANPDVSRLQLDHNSILYSPSKLTGDDWKVPITGFSPGGSVFGFSPLGKTPSPLGNGQGKSPSPESGAQTTSKSPSPLSKNSLNLPSPEQGKAPSPDTPSTDSAKRSRRFFPASPWAV